MSTSIHPIIAEMKTIVELFSRPGVGELIDRIYERHSAGCCWHIVLDDDNWDFDCIDHCIEWAKENNCDECMQLGTLLARASEDNK